MKFYLAITMAFLFAVFPLAKNAAAQAVKVVATYSILGDVVKNVGGENIELAVLVGPDGDAHTFEPTPKESILLAEAEIIFENGLYFEHWINSLYAASGSKAKRIVVTEKIVPISLATHERIDRSGNPKDVDPHAWQDVGNVMIMTERVRDGLMAVDPVNAPIYQKNAQQYLVQLSDLDRWVIEALKSIPGEKRKLVTSHDALGYFAKHYGFVVIGTAIPSATTEAEDPGAGKTAQLLNLIRSSGVKVLFAENIHNAKLLEALAKEAGVVMAPRLYTDALGPPGSAGETYIKMIQHNVNIFREYLK